MRWLLPLLFWPLLAAQAQVQSSIVSTTGRGDSLFVTVAFDSVHLKVDTVTVVRVDTVYRSLPNLAVRVGPWAPPLDSIKNYSAVLFSGPTPYAGLAQAKTRGTTVVLYLARNFSKKNGVMSVATAKAFLDTWPDITPYVQDGTVWGVMVGDDVRGTEIWGPNAPYFAQLDSIGLYAKQKWPSIRTIIRDVPSKMSYRWKWIDYAWGQYGAQPRNGEVGAYRDREIAAIDSLARTTSMKCLVFGLNAVDGGDGSSGIRGSVTGRTEMTAVEYERYARALLPYTPLLLHWQYRPETEARLLPAIRKIQAAADSVPAKVCP